MAGIFDTVGNKLNNLGFAGNMGLLSAGANLLEGGKFGDSVNQGLNTFQNFNKIDEDKKRKDMIDKLITEGGFTTQEQALIRASNNPASVAVQIRNQKATLAAQPKKIIKGADGYNYYSDGSRVLPSITAKDATKAPVTRKGADGYLRFVGGDNDGTRVFPSIKSPEGQPKTAKDANGILRYVGGDQAGERVFPDVVKDDSSSSDPNYQRAGSFMDENNKIYSGVTFNPSNNKHYQGDQELDVSNMKPLNDSFFSLGIPNFGQFDKINEAVNDDETSLKRYASYLGSIDKAGVGLERLGDKMSTYFKTFFSTNAKKYGLTEQELALKVASGQLQGLLGSARIETVGPGVMTEQDALRILSNLGDDVSFYQNPEVVTAQISNLFQTKYGRYLRNINKYNSAVGSGAFPQYQAKTAIDIDTALLSSEVANSINSGNTNLELGSVPFPQNNDFSALKNNELLAISTSGLSQEQDAALDAEYKRRGF